MWRFVITRRQQLSAPVINSNKINYTTTIIGWLFDCRTDRDKEVGEDGERRWVRWGEENNRKKEKGGGKYRRWIDHV